MEDRCQLLVEDKTTESFSKAVNNYLDFAWISTIRDVCGTVEWEATSNTRGSWFKSSAQKALMEHSILYCFEKWQSTVNRLRTNLPLLCQTEAFLFNIYDIFSSKTKKPIDRVTLRAMICLSVPLMLPHIARIMAVGVAQAQLEEWLLITSEISSSNAVVGNIYWNNFRFAPV